MTRTNNIWHNVDWWTIGMFLVLCIYGWMNIVGASWSFDQTSLFAFEYRSGKQLVWIGTALLMGTVLLLLDEHLYERMAYPLYAIMVVILIITPFLSRGGEGVKGSLSWITLGPLSIQPAEFSKYIVALVLSSYMGRYGYKIKSWHDLILPALFILVPMVIEVVWQKETGSALVLASFALMFYREGMTGYVLLCACAAVLFFIVVIRFGATPLPLGIGTWGMLMAMIFIMGIMIYFFISKSKEKHARAGYWMLLGIALSYVIALIVNHWVPVPFVWLSYALLLIEAVGITILCFYNRAYQLLWAVLISLLFVGYSNACDYLFYHVLQPHQRGRIEVLLGMTDDPLGAGYNVHQSLIAIGSGGLAGKGFLQGTQTKMNFVPEQATDFIFCTVGEEWGFLGSAFLLILYAAFILRLIHIAERQKDMFSQIYAYCVVSIFLFHLAINVGMVIGLLPVIGIPLPFLSYGGSSMWGFSLLLFTLLRLDAARVNKMR